MQMTPWMLRPGSMWVLVGAMSLLLDVSDLSGLIVAVCVVRIARA